MKDEWGDRYAVKVGSGHVDMYAEHVADHYDEGANAVILQLSPEAAVDLAFLLMKKGPSKLDWTRSCTS